MRDEGVTHGDLHPVRTPILAHLNVAHTLLKPNILVDDAGKVKLTDLGLSVIVDGTPYRYGSKHGGGLVNYTAPELIDKTPFGLESRRPTPESDVFSFGCVAFAVRPTAFLLCIAESLT